MKEGTTMKTLTRLAFGTAIFAASIGAAFAHPHLTAAGPIPGSTIATSPKNIRIQFSEAIEIAFSGIDVKNQAGQSQALGAATIDPKDKKILVVPVESKLEPGTYTVS